MALTQPELEALASPEMAYWYACNVIQARWPVGEAAIATSPKWAYCYAYDVIEGRWPPGEPVIATDPEWAAEYYNDFRKEFTEKEQVLWLLNL